MSESDTNNLSNGPNSVDSILSQYNNIVHAATSLRHSDIIKALEHSQACQIFVRAIQSNESVEGFESFTATCELTDFFNKEPEDSASFGFQLLHHHIYYKSDPNNPEREAFRIAHELGHLSLHWPLDNERRSRKVTGVLEDVGSFYLVNFTEQDERDADIFASLLCAHSFTSNTSMPKYSMTAEEAKELVSSYFSKGYFQSRGTAN